MNNAQLTDCPQDTFFKLYAKGFVRTWILKKCLGKGGPKSAAPLWMQEQIQSDLAPFSRVDVTKEAIDRTWNLHHKKWELLRVKIVNNRLFLQSECPDMLRVSYLKGGFEALARWISLPDADFLLSLSDSLDGISPDVPIFAFANNPKLSSRIVLMPDREALSGRYWKFLRSVEKAKRFFPWEKKIEQCCWRGTMTGGLFTPLNFLTFPRSQSILLSLKNPDWFDARYVASSAIRNALKEYSSYFGNSMSIEEQIQYKYQLLIDGHSCAYSRAYWQLFSNCLLFKQQSDAVQWYYGALIPFVHYVPIKSDLSDLIEKIQWAKSHDREVQNISLKAQEFARENLTFERIFQYMHLLLLEYSKLQKIK